MAIRLLSASHIQVGSGYMPVRTGLVMVVMVEGVVVIVIDPWEWRPAAGDGRSGFETFIQRCTEQLKLSAR
ncbi:hypothetical protein GCM10008901_15250 [Bifidobacterium pullorum]